MRRFVRTKRIVNSINRLMFEEHQDNVFEESQVMRSYSAGIVDGLALALIELQGKESVNSPAFPLSISFYDDDEPTVRYPSPKAVERLRERVFDIQNNSTELFEKEEAK